MRTALLALSAPPMAAGAARAEQAWLPRPDREAVFAEASASASTPTWRSWATAIAPWATTWPRSG